MKDFDPAAAGRLYVVGTPIGNLGDLSPRALAVLAEADQVAAEDTRVSGSLLRHFGVHTPLISFHEHNTRMRLPHLLDALESGRRIALVSDAGMPCISDPGTALVRACRVRGIPVETVPGPSAVVTALAGSGMDCAHFYFEGFLPPRGQPRHRRLSALDSLTETAVVLYEAPHRLVRTLKDFAEQGWGNRLVCLARELTKRYETFLSMTVAETLDYFQSHEPRGEYVLILEAVSDGSRNPILPGRRPADAGPALKGTPVAPGGPNVQVAPGAPGRPGATGRPNTPDVPNTSGARPADAGAAGGVPAAGSLTAEQMAVAWAVLQLKAGQRVKTVAKTLKNDFGAGGFLPAGGYYDWVVGLRAYCDAAEPAGDDIIKI